VTPGTMGRWSVGLLVAASMAAGAAPRYRAVDLSAVGARASPVAIDDDGTVAFNEFVNGQFVATLFDSKSEQVIARLPGDIVRALSSDGNLAGSSPSGSWAIVDGVRTAVPLGVALGVNDRGQVAGFAGGFFPRAALFDTRDGTVTDLGTLGGLQSVALAINDHGQATGESNPAGTQAVHAFRWSRGIMEDLGTLGGESSFGNAIDHEGRVVGVADTGPSEAHAFVSDERGMHDLGTLPGCRRSEALGINGEGTVVGAASRCDPAVAVSDRGFVVVDGAMIDLNDVAPALPDGFVYSRAIAVNDHGTVIGLAQGPRASRPVVLVPVDR